MTRSSPERRGPVSNMLDGNRWQVGSSKHRAFGWLDGQAYSVAIVFFTFEALFAPDLLQVMLPKEFDIPVAILTLCGFIVFSAEIVLNFWVKRDYGANRGADRFTVFLIIDVVGTLSLIPDFIIIFGVEYTATKSAALARAGRAARIGARMARLVRMFRLDEEEASFGPDGKKLVTTPSSIGAVVADKISTRVVLLVMLLIVVLPIITHSEPPTMEETAIELMAAMVATVSVSVNTEAKMLEFVSWYNSCSFNRCERSEEIVYLKDMITGDTIDLRLHPTTGNSLDEYERYRDSEMRSFTYTICGDGSTASTSHHQSQYPACESGSSVTQAYRVTFQIKNILHEQSVMSLCFMTVVVLIFGLGAGGFLADVQTYVIAPVERISALTSNLSSTLKFLAPNTSLADDNKRKRALDAATVVDSGGCCGGETAETDGVDEDDDDIKILGEQVQKMLELLQIGFGEAGTKIIEQNLTANTEQLQPMMPGQFVDEIFVGFIMLEHFDAVTDVMGADVMLYANYIGEFVHNCVVETGGNPNKNMGGAILCVWRGENGASAGYESFQKAIRGVNNDPKVRALCDRYNEQLISYDGGKLNHDGHYRAELAGGLHCGWAVRKYC